MLTSIAKIMVVVGLLGIFLAAHGVILALHAMKVVYGDAPRYSHPYLSQLPTALVVLAAGITIFFIAAKGLDALHALKMRKKALARAKREREQKLVAFMERDL